MKINIFLTEITDDAMQIVIYIVLGIIVVSLLIWMIRYKSIGVLGAISYIGYIALLTLIIRSHKCHSINRKSFSNGNCTYI